MASAIVSLSGLLNQIYYSTIAPPELDAGEAGPWRPPQWANFPVFTLVAKDPVTGDPTAYVFDGTIRVEHEQPTVITLNPVQTGAAISDNAFIVPAKVTVELAMSDAMQSYVVSNWVDSPSKSVSAYQKLIAIQRQRLPVQVSTRLRQYDRMMIADVRAEEAKETRYGLKCHVTFIEILTASISQEEASIQPNSLLPQATNQTPSGQVQASSVPASVRLQHNITNAVGAVADAAAVNQVAASGTWSSTNISSLTKVILEN